MKAFACIFGIMFLATGLGMDSEEKTYQMAAVTLLMIATGACLLMYGLSRRTYRGR